MRSGIDYAVALSDSGLLIEIVVKQNGGMVDSIQIDVSAWPAIVEAVRQVELQRTVEAQIENILAGDDDD